MARRKKVGPVDVDKLLVSIGGSEQGESGERRARTVRVERRELTDEQQAEGEEVV